MLSNGQKSLFEKIIGISLMNEQEFINYSIGMKYSLSNREKSEIDENDFYYWNNGAFLYTAESKDKNTEIYFANAGNDKCLSLIHISEPTRRP